MGLKVIGAGFGRTGTESLRLALTQLGFGACHHMHEVMNSPEQVAIWLKVIAGDRPDWDRIFTGFASACDCPSAHWWPELMAHWPEAKVVLTWREPESWWGSYAKTILRSISQGRTEHVGTALLAGKVFEGRHGDKARVLALYRANIERALAQVPPGRLLVHRLGDGWAPLCHFLDAPIPDAPYPRANDAAAFHDRDKNAPA